VDFIHTFIAGRSGASVLLLHGSGGDETDLIPVARAVAPGAALLSPRGKVVDQGMTRFFRMDKSDAAERATELLEWIPLAAAQHGIDPTSIYALGYSNGANVAATAMLLKPGVIAGACLLRSRLVFQPERLPDLAGAPVLISAGQSDDIIPATDAEALGRVLTDAGAHVDLAIQNAGHELTPGDFALAKQWFARLTAGSSKP
jgi:phospholipase/carboxylesterase